MMQSGAPAVAMSKVRIDRGGNTILRDISLQLPRGSITAVLGPSGSGKSTLLAALTGELVPVEGTVEVLGQAVPRASRALLEMRKGIGVLLQGNGLLTDLSVGENVALPLRTHTRLPPPVITRWNSSSMRSACWLRSMRIRASCPAAWHGAWRWRAPWPWTRR